MSSDKGSSWSKVPAGMVTLLFMFATVAIYVEPAFATFATKSPEPSILKNVYTDLLNGFSKSSTSSLSVLGLLGLAIGTTTIFTGLMKMKESIDKPDEFKKSIIYIIIGSLFCGLVTFNSLAGNTLFGTGMSLNTMGWGDTSTASDKVKEALQFAVLMLRLVGVYCFISALSSIKTFAHNQDHAAFNTAKVRFVSAILLTNFPLFVRALASTMGGDIGGKLLLWFPT